MEFTLNWFCEIGSMWFMELVVMWACCLLWLSLRIEVRYWHVLFDNMLGSWCWCIRLMYDIAMKLVIICLGYKLPWIRLSSGKYDSCGIHYMWAWYVNSIGASQCICTTTSHSWVWVHNWNQTPCRWMMDGLGKVGLKIRVSRMVEFIRKRIGSELARRGMATSRVKGPVIGSQFRWWRGHKVRRCTRHRGLKSRNPVSVGWPLVEVHKYQPQERPGINFKRYSHWGQTTNDGGLGKPGFHTHGIAWGSGAGKARV